MENMSSQNSPQTQLSTLDGIKSRNGIVMDLFDHGPVLMVIEGQLIQADSLSICIDVTNSNNPMVEAWHPSTYNTITATLETRSDITITHSIAPKKIYLFNNKHKVVFEDATISSYHRDGEDTELTFEAEDYTPSVNWNSQFA